MPFKEKIIGPNESNDFGKSSAPELARDPRRQGDCTRTGWRATHRLQSRLQAPSKPKSRIRSYYYHYFQACRSDGPRWLERCRFQAWRRCVRLLLERFWPHVPQPSALSRLAREEPSSGRVRHCAPSLLSSSFFWPSIPMYLLGLAQAQQRRLAPQGRGLTGRKNDLRTGSMLKRTQQKDLSRKNTQDDLFQ